VLPLSQRATALVLAAASATWTVIAFVRTPRVARLIGASEGEVRALGVRDLGIGVTLALSRDPRPAIAARVLLEAADALRYGRGRPKVLALTGAFAALGAAALLDRGR
jgi:hypothetical protein